MLSVPRPVPPVSDDRSVSPPSVTLWSVRRRLRSNFLFTLSDGAEVVLGNIRPQAKVDGLTAWDGYPESGIGVRIKKRNHSSSLKERTRTLSGHLCDMKLGFRYIACFNPSNETGFPSISLPWKGALMFLDSLKSKCRNVHSIPDRDCLRLGIMTCLYY